MVNVVYNYRECLAEHVGHSEDAALKCPYAGDYTCDVEIAQHEISEVWPIFILIYLNLFSCQKNMTLFESIHSGILCWEGLWLYSNLDVYFSRNVKESAVNSPVAVS